MCTGQLVFSQVTDHLPMHTSRRCVKRYQVKRPLFSWTQISEEYDVQGGGDEQERKEQEGYAGAHEGSP